MPLLSTLQWLPIHSEYNLRSLTWLTLSGPSLHLTLLLNPSAKIAVHLCQACLHRRALTRSILLLEIITPLQPTLRCVHGSLSHSVQIAAHLSHLQRSSLTALSKVHSSLSPVSSPALLFILTLTTTRTHRPSPREPTILVCPGDSWAKGLSVLKSQKSQANWDGLVTLYHPYQNINLMRKRLFCSLLYS